MAKITSRPVSPILRGHDAASGKAAAIAQPLHLQPHRQRRIARPQKVAVQRVHRPPATVADAAASACATTCPP